MADDDDVEAFARPSPTGATAIRAIASAIHEAGYDVTDREDYRRFADDIRTMRERLRQEEDRDARRRRWQTIAISAVATGGVGALIQWLPSFLRFFGWHGPGQAGK